jgi:hypothetical protein
MNGNKLTYTLLGFAFTVILSLLLLVVGMVNHNANRIDNRLILIEQKVDSNYNLSTQARITIIERIARLEALIRQ